MHHQNISQEQMRLRFAGSNAGPKGARGQSNTINIDLQNQKHETQHTDYSHGNEIELDVDDDHLLIPNIPENTIDNTNNSAQAQKGVKKKHPKGNQKMNTDIIIQDEDLYGEAPEFTENKGQFKSSSFEDLKKQAKKKQQSTPIKDPLPNVQISKFLPEVDQIMKFVTDQVDRNDSFSLFKFEPFVFQNTPYSTELASLVDHKENHN